MQTPNPALFYKALGDLIRRRRKQLGLTQEKLAARLGISRASIANIETGRQKILVHQLFQLAAVLEMAAEDFLVVPAGESADQNLENLPLPTNLSPKQKAQISRLLSDTKAAPSRDKSEE